MHVIVLDDAMHRGRTQWVCRGLVLWCCGACACCASEMPEGMRNDEGRCPWCTIFLGMSSAIHVSGILAVSCGSEVFNPLYRCSATPRSASSHHGHAPSAAGPACSQCMYPYWGTGALLCKTPCDDCNGRGNCSWGKTGTGMCDCIPGTWSRFVRRAWETCLG